MGRTVAMKIGSKQVAFLEEVVAGSSAPAGLVRRARVVLLSAEGVSGREIAVQLDLSPEQVSRIRARFDPQAGGRAHGERLLGIHEEGGARLRDQELHVILDNSSTHSTPDIQTWLAEHPAVHFHYTPTSTS